MATSEPNPTALAWDSIDHYDGERLKAWNVIETAAAFTADTLRREVDE